jgi:hypothetical protein
LKKKPPFIDLDACEDNAPQAVTVRELAETTARLPINPSYGENDCPENLPIGEQDSGEILLVSAPRPALAFVTPSLPPMPIILPTDGVSPENNMSEDDVSGLHEVRQEPARPHVPAVSTPPKDNPIPTSSNEVSPSSTVSPIGNTPPAEDALPVGLIPSNREPILLGGITLSEDDDAAGEDGQPIERETPPDEEPEQISEAIPPPQVVQNVSHNPAQPPEDVIPPKDDPIPTSSNEVSPSGTVSPKDEMPEDEKPDRWDLRQDASLSLPKVIQPAPKNPALSPEGEIAEREPSPEREPVSPPPKENPEDVWLRTICLRTICLSRKQYNKLRHCPRRPKFRSCPTHKSLSVNHRLKGSLCRRPQKILRQYYSRRRSFNPRQKTLRQIALCHRLQKIRCP